MIESRTRFWSGKIKTGLGRVWFKVVEGGSGTPVIFLHGGPGSVHDSFEPLEILSDERMLVFYDQIGGGRSDRLTDLSALSVDYFVSELEILRAALDIDKLHLRGGSWGTALAVEYALAYPTRVASLVLSSPFLSTRLWIDDARILKASMGKEWNEIVDRNETAGTTNSYEYEAAKEDFRKKYICRMEKLPLPIARGRVGFAKDVYLHMWGPAEFTSTGILKDYDCTSRLGELRAPVLYLCGRYDEARPETVRLFHELTPDSRMIVFENSSHSIHHEEPEAHFQTVREFWRGLEAKA